MQYTAPIGERQLRGEWFSRRNACFWPAVARYGHLSLIDPMPMATTGSS